MTTAQKKPLFAVATAIVGAVFFILLPAKEYSQAYISAFVFLILLPSLVIRYVFKEKVSVYGFDKTPNTRQIVWVSATLVASIMVYLTAFSLVDGLKQASPDRSISGGLFLFLIYALFLSTLQAGIYEFFFRSFLQLSLAKYFGIWSVALQTALFVAFLAFSGNLGWATMPLVFSSIVSGLIMHFTRSFLLCFLFSWLFVIIGDVIVLRFLI